MTTVHSPAAHRVLRTEIPGPVSRELHERRSRSVSSAVVSVLPTYVASADGGLITDVDGNTLIDLGSGIAVTNVGHGAPAVVDRLRAQAGFYTHTCFMVTPYEPYVQVCEQLAELTPGEHEKRSALFNSGAEAVENAVKVARAATGRDAVVVLDHAYHGRTNLTMAMTARAAPYKRGFGPFSPEVYRVPGSYPFRDPHGLTGRQAADRALELVTRQVGADAVAAVVVEPIQGEGGFIEPAPGFLPALSAWCRENGAVLVADEIQTGFCRTGDWFACEHEGVVPDLVVTAKGIAGGMPLAAVTGRAELMDALPAGSIGGTYGGNPVACAAALGAIQTMRDGDLAARARAIADRTLPRLRALAERVDVLGEVRGRGAMLALEFVRPGTTEPDAVRTQQVARACHAAGVVVLTCGSHGNVIRLLPPLTIPFTALDEGLAVVEHAVETGTAMRTAS